MARLPQSGEIAETISQTELVKALECPICTSVPYPPIYGCVNGHIACNACRPKLQHCGVCRQPFWEGRNYVLEQILMGSKFYCNYKELGCKEVLLGNDLKKHLKTCEFGPQFAENSDVIPPSLSEWISCSNGELPPDAVEGGSDGHGNKLYVARANHEGGKIPGYYNVITQKAHIPWGGREYEKTEYQILTANPELVSWTSAEDGFVPPLAIPGGPSEDGEMLYIGRWPAVNTLLCLGKIHPSHRVCYIGFQGLELACPAYEVLVRNVNIEPDPDDAEPLPALPALDEDIIYID